LFLDRDFHCVGLGGIGGPYRLDSGHQVYQVPDDVKAAVPEHIRKAARELGQKVFKERLKEIEMSEYEHEVYEKYLNKISSEIKMLRSIIESLEAKSNDRQWVVNIFLSNILIYFSFSVIVQRVIGMNEN
jgi:DNA mismatch repair ATPase MutS